MKIYYTSIKGRRESNEDRHNIILNINQLNDKLLPINLLTIFDGHGGTYVSEYLEKYLPLYYCNSKLKLPFSKKYHEETFKNLQERIIKNKNGHRSGSTCLLNIMYKYENELFMNIVNLGDCRMVIVYNNGSFKQVTVDHKPDDKIEKKRLKNMGGEIYKDSEGTYRIGDLSLSRAFGDEDNAPYISQIPDVYYKKITPDTKYVVMACDGLWDVIKNKNLYKLLENSTKNNKNLAVDLAEHALKIGSTDNISVIVLHFQDN
jgi:serine/threonine protein phosphatase PrpC